MTNRSTGQARASPRRHVVWAEAGWLALLAGFLSACSQAATPAPRQDGGLTTESWVLLLAIGMIVVALLIAAILAANRRSVAKAAAAAELYGYLSEIIAGARWVHDSGTVAVLLATDSDRLLTTWNEVRRRMVDLESQIATLAAQTSEPDLHHDLRYLGLCVADLRSAEEGYVSTRTRSSDRAGELTRTSDETVSLRRRQLSTAIASLAAEMRG